MIDATIQKLDTLIKESDTILVTCHSSPDHDAMGSLLAMYKILTEQYKKTVIAVAETVSPTFSFLPGFNTLSRSNIIQTLTENNPDLVIFLDMSVWHMTSPVSSQSIREFIESREIKTIVIDHHPPEIRTIESTVTLNPGDNSTCQSLYRIFFEGLKHELTPEVADCLLAGIISDTDRFKYDHDSLPYTFSILPSILSKSTQTIESLSRKMSSIPASTLRPLHLLVKNTFLFDGIVCSYISDADIVINSLIKSDISTAVKYYLSNIMLNIADMSFGFVVYPMMTKEDTYTISFRAAKESKVKEIAEKLGGGGHESAAAARIYAQTTDEVIEKVKGIIKEVNN